MTDTLYITKINEVHIRVDCESGLAMELSEYFTFMVPNAKFHPLVRQKLWDGKIKLFNLMTKTVYAGLFQSILAFARNRGYAVEFGEEFNETSFSLNEAEHFAKSLNLPFTPRDYQLAALAHAVRKTRSLLLSPTASGKSLIIYMIAQYYAKRTLIIVPTISLVHQLADDFVSYGYDEPIHKITAGADKKTNHMITISTWQSIFKQPKSWFDQYDVVMGDECHLFKAKSLTAIMDKLTECKHRFGFTGTLDGIETNKMVLEGLFGTAKRVASTADLIEQKHLAELKIKILVLKYAEEVRKVNKDNDYQTEMDFIVGHQGRNKFIKNLALSLKGNTLLLFQYVEKHGKDLHKSIKDAAGDRPVHFVYGGIDGDTREDIRKLVETQIDAIIVASSGVFSTGINVKNIHNIIFASPGKSKIKTLQSIGRGLRKSNIKDSVTLFDIADDLSWKSKQNYTMQHLKERKKIYEEEEFAFKIYDIEI